MFHFHHKLLEKVNKIIFRIFCLCLGLKGLMDLSKAYDCVNHDLIIVKLEAYGVGENSLRVIQNYLFQRQRVKVGSSFSE